MSDWPITLHRVSGDELAAELAAAMRESGGGKLTRVADLYLAGVCAERLAERLIIAGFVVYRRA